MDAVMAAVVEAAFRPEGHGAAGAGIVVVGLILVGLWALISKFRG
jgi:hypothetical protein